MRRPPLLRLRLWAPKRKAIIRRLRLVARAVTMARRLKRLRPAKVRRKVTLAASPPGTETSKERARLRPKVKRARSLVGQRILQAHPRVRERLNKENPCDVGFAVSSWLSRPPSP